MKGIKIALYDARTIVFSSRFVLLSAIALMFFDMSMRPVREFADAFHLGIVPAALPFFLADISYSNAALLLLVLLFSDIPLKGRAQNFVMQRGSSLVCCGTGHALALFLSGAAFMLELLLFSVLTALPDLLFGGWGKVWGSIASGQALELGYQYTMGASSSVLEAYGPWQAVGISLLLFFLTGCLYAVVEYMLNGLSRSRLGTAVLSAWSVAWILLANAPFPWMRPLLAGAPQAWLDLSRLTPGRALERAGFLAVAVIALSAVAVFLVKRRKIEMVK